MTDVSRNHLLFRIELNSRSASSIRFWGEEGREEEERTHRRGEEVTRFKDYHTRIGLYIIPRPPFVGWEQGCGNPC